MFVVYQENIATDFAWLLPSANEVFTCLSFWPGACLPQCMLGCTHPWADTPLARHSPHRQTPPGQTHPPGQTLPQQMATAADSTHPTGMHSCWYLSLIGYLLGTSHTKVNQRVSWMLFQLQDLDNYRVFSCTRRYISPGHYTQQEM